MRPKVEIEIDVPDAVWRALRDCEIYCEKYCCGENAFQLFPENMQPWVEESTPEEIVQVRQDVDNLIEQATRLGSKVGLKWFSGDDPNGPRAWLEDVRECLIEATSPNTTQPDGTPIIRQILAKVRVLTAEEKYHGHDFPPVPLTSERLEVLLPDRALTAILTLTIDPLSPGKEATASLRFPLPRRIQPFLSVGASLDLDHHRGRKTVDATILELFSQAAG